MITAMAASSLLRLLRPGPTMLSKSSWEFSPRTRRKGRKITRKNDVRHHRNANEKNGKEEVQIPISVSPPGKAAPCGSSSELDFPGSSMSEPPPFGT